VVARILEDGGFLVRTASNDLEALIAAYEMRRRVIVMDVCRPVLDGVEATRLIKAGETTRDARVIAYTGTSSFETSPTPTLFAAVLTKPATPVAVLATVQQVASLSVSRESINFLAQRNPLPSRPTCGAVDA
jgi:CheY-like chemotaxis protein